MDFDVLFVGSGQGAYNGAIPMSQAGLNVGLIEEGLFGGVCTNRGCNAKITLDRPVELMRQVEALSGRGFDAMPTLNWHDLMLHKHEVIDGLSYGNEQKLVNGGVHVIKGHAHFVDAHTLAVGDQQYTADKIVLVTGRHPHRLDIPGSDLFHDSTDFLVLEDMPKRMTIIGAGYVGMEFATIANAFGSDVTVILRGNQPLREFYAPYVDLVVADLRERGVKFQFNETLLNAEQTDDGIVLHGENDYRHTTDYVIDATGRIPNTQNMDWDKIGLKYDPIKGLPVNDHLETNVPGIYATGDILDKPQPKITPVAIFESLYLFHQFTGQTKAAIDYPAIATVAFTSPRLATVGVSVAEAKKDPERYHIETADYNHDWFRQVGNENWGGVTLVFEGDYLVGATTISNDAVDTINGLVDVIEAKMTHADVERLIYLFPSTAHSYMRKL